MRSLTLVELIVVIIIIGILATLAMPQFAVTKERALSKEAIANLKLIAAAERIYRMENNNYYPSSGSESDIDDINSNLKLFLVETNWEYSIDGGTNTFTAYAQRKGKTCKYTLTSANAIAGTEPTGTGCP